MTILDSLGGQAAVVKAGEDPQLKLTPDAEALALFAGLFAMLQPQEGTDASQEAADQVPGEPTPLPDGQTIPAASDKSTSVALPAAARLMLAGTPATATSGDQPGMAETASLAQLLIAAKSLSEDADMPPASGAPTIPDVETDAPTDMTTAKAILARAIEILDDIDSAPGHVPAARADTPLVDPESSGELALEPALPNLPGLIVRMVVQPAPTPEFVGPMPAVPAVARTMVQPAPAAEFVGPMLAVPVAEPAPTAEFVGPMPAVPVAQPAPTAEFVGPMPAVPVAQPAPTAEFVGPMPVASAPVVSAPVMSLPATPVQLVAQPAPSAEFVGPMPLRPVPLFGHGETGPAQTGPAQTGPAQTGPGQTGPAQTGHVQAGQGQVGIWQSDVDGMAMTSDGLPAVKGGLEQKAGGGATLDQVRMRQQMVESAGTRPTFGTESGKMDPASAPGMTSRDGRLYAEPPAAGGSQLSSAGTSSSSQSSSVQSSSTQAAAASGGQAGGQTGGQNHSGQGGGQSASQGFADAAPSRDLADRAMLHRLNTANAGWSETMIKRLTSDLRSGVQTVRIILEPRHLGRLNVDLGLRNGKASIRIAAETAEAAKLLGSARGQLGQMFEQSGMRLASFQTSAGGQDATMDGSGGQTGHGQSQDSGKNAGRDQGFSNKLTTADSDMRQAGDNPDDQDFALRAGETAVLSVLA
ncbi:MAG: flagellar hook-length control protein FliK [Pseudomonadota bacterium]|nr:flagellar hook-length control protein FliK [Pseudomonadota bacterium]